MTKTAVIPSRRYKSIDPRIRVGIDNLNPCCAATTMRDDIGIVMLRRITAGQRFPSRGNHAHIHKRDKTSASRSCRKGRRTVGIEEMSAGVIAFVKLHEAWAVPIVYLLAFGESLAFLSLLLPSTVILLGIGGLIGASGIQFLPIWAAAVTGSILGYAVSYWVGLYFKDDITTIWPFSRYPEMIPRGKAFFDKYGAYGVFFGHFFGPLRVVVPVVAGMYAMPQLPFQLANVLSSALWSTGVLVPGFIGLRYWLG